MFKLKSYTKIISILLVSWVISSALLIVFVDNSPTIRPHLGAYIAQRFQQGRSDFIARLSFLQTKPNPQTNMTAKEVDQQVESIKTALIDIPSQMVSKGVYAKTDGKVSMTIINTDEIEKVKYTFTIKGKPIDIIVPKEYMKKNGFTEADIKKQAESLQ